MRPPLAAGFNPVRLVVALVIALGLASTPIQCGLAAGPHSLFVAVDAPAARAGERVVIIVDHGAHHGHHHHHQHQHGAAPATERAPATPLEAGMTGPSFSAPAEHASPAAPLVAVLPEPAAPDRGTAGDAIVSGDAVPVAASVIPDVPPPKGA